jgi:hypothetical protein
MTRKLDNWIDGFMSYTKDLPSPDLFKKWCAISAVAGAMERKCWIRTMGSKLYPSMYIILVAPPGVGKTVVSSLVRNMWLELEGQHVANSSVSKASLIDDLRDATREIMRPGEDPSIVRFNSLKVAANELGVLIPAYDNEFMNVLTDIYDGHGYSERRRTKDLQFNLNAPQFHLLAATTPSYLNNILPEGAWDQGFLSRTMLVYSGVRTLVDPFADTRNSDINDKDLRSDLKKIGEAYGEYKFTDESKAMITKWHMENGPPTPEHPKLHHYLTRRTQHLLKLCMVAAAATSSKKVIEIDHVQLALDWLIEVEHFIPDIFKSMSMGGDSKAIEETWYFVYKTYTTSKDKDPVPAARVFRFLQERVPAHAVEHIIGIMVKAGLLKEKQVNKIGVCYIPMEKGV